MPDTDTRAREHLANERTFLAWIRTGLAMIVFGFALGRFGVAMHQFMELQGRMPKTTGMSVWFGLISIVAGVAMVLMRYHTTKTQLEEGLFKPAGFVIDVIAIVATLLGAALAGYLFFVEKNM
jgi:putative membrane protein